MSNKLSIGPLSTSVSLGPVTLSAGWTPTTSAQLFWAGVASLVTSFAKHRPTVGFGVLGKASTSKGFQIAAAGLIGAAIITHLLSAAENR